MPPTTLKVRTNVADQGLEKQIADTALIAATYWSKTVVPCRKGTTISIAVRPTHDEGPARFNNGIDLFDTRGRRVGTRGNPPNRVWEQKAEASTSPDKRFLCPNLSKNALVARFGNDAPFIVGDSWTGTATAENLFVALNDKIGGFNNNVGDYTVVVQVG